MNPHSWQTAAVAAYERHGGVFVGLDPGAGKTWTAAAIARRCVRPLVCAPAAVIPQTMRMFREYGVPCFRADSDAEEDGVGFVSYSWLQRSAAVGFLEDYGPTDVLCDEAHRIRRIQTNTAGRRLWRYLVANPTVRVGWFTGTPGVGAGLAYGLRAALRGSRLVPQTRHAIEEWEERLASDPAARAVFLEALQAEPGVFMGAAPGYGGRIVLRVVRRPPAMALPPTWELPDGWMLGSPSEAADVAKCMAWGWWPRREPRPSTRYLDARRAWAGAVRRVVAAGGADTELQVRALLPREYAAWHAVEQSETVGDAVPVWEHAPAVAAAPAWTIIWAHHVALQERVAAELGVPRHGPGGLDADGVRIDDQTAPVIVASISACHAGFNLQRYAHNVVLEPAADPDVWRQLVGRTARQGNAATEVTFDIVINCPESESALRTAIDRAKLTFEQTGKANPITELEF